MTRSPDDGKPSPTHTSSEKEAVKTTIVGGQPSGKNRPLPPIPVGIEQLLAMASVNDEFAAALYADRDQAISASGVELTRTEQGILSAIDGGTLRRMVANIDGGVPNRERRAFLTRSAAALLVLAGGAVPSGACGGDKKSDPAPGLTPPSPGDPKDAAPPATTPDATHPATRGIQPDRPGPTKGIRPDRPEGGKVTGARPDRPDAGGGDVGSSHGSEQTTTGIRPDRPIKQPTRGIRPDRPDDIEPIEPE